MPQAAATTTMTTTPAVRGMRGIVPAATGSGAEGGRVLLDDGRLPLGLPDAPQDTGARDVEGVGEFAGRRADVRQLRLQATHDVDLAAKVVERARDRLRVALDGGIAERDEGQDARSAVSGLERDGVIGLQVVGREDIRSNEGQDVIAVGAVCGVKTAFAIAADRFTRASASSFVIRARASVGPSPRRRSGGCTRVRVGSIVMTRSPFLLVIASPPSVPVRSTRSPRPCASAPRRSSSAASKSSPSAVLASALLSACPTGVLEGLEPLVETAELVAHLGAELIERAAAAGRVEQGGELRGVTIEVTAQRLTKTTEGGVAPALVEEVAHEPMELPESPRYTSSWRGSRPSPSAKFVRSVVSSALAARPGSPPGHSPVGRLGAPTSTLTVDSRCRWPAGRCAALARQAQRGPRPVPPRRRRQAPGGEASSPSTVMACPVTVTVVRASFMHGASASHVTAPWVSSFRRTE